MKLLNECFIFLKQHVFIGKCRWIVNWNKCIQCARMHLMHAQPAMNRSPCILLIFGTLMLLIGYHLKLYPLSINDRFENFKCIYHHGHRHRHWHTINQRFRISIWFLFQWTRLISCVANYVILQMRSKDGNEEGKRKLKMH